MIARLRSNPPAASEIGAGGPGSRTGPPINLTTADLTLRKMVADKLAVLASATGEARTVAAVRWWLAAIENTPNNDGRHLPSDGRPDHKDLTLMDFATLSDEQLCDWIEKALAELNGRSRYPRPVR